MYTYTCNNIYIYIYICTRRGVLFCLPTLRSQAPGEHLSGAKGARGLNGGEQSAARHSNR